MTRNDIQTGDILILSNGNEFRIISVNKIFYILSEGDYCTSTRLDSMCFNDLTPVAGKATIESIKRDNRIIWTRPIVMTIAQIEQALKLSPGSLRIKD